MGHIEIQIANTALLQGIKQLLTPRLYAQCFVSGFSGLILDHLEAGIIGPAAPTAQGDCPGMPGSPGSVTVPARVGVFLVFTDDVIAANGGPASTQHGALLTGQFFLTITGTIVTATYGCVAHDNGYKLLFGLVAGQFPPPQDGQAKATALFKQWEAAVQNALGGTPLLTYDFGPNLPSQLTSVPFGRSQLSADDMRIAIRFETGDVNSDGDWTAFLNGTLEDHLYGNAWSMFVSAESAVQIANTSIAQAISGSGAVLGGSTWAPQGQTAAVNSSVSVTFHVHVDVVGYTFDGDVNVVFDLTTKFTIEHDPNLAEGSLRTDISYVYSTSVDFPVDVHLDLSQYISFPGFTKVGDQEFFQDTPIPTMVLEEQLTLTATDVLGFADGMLIVGRAGLAQAMKAPDCNVGASPFVLQYLTSCSGYLNHTQGPPTPSNVTAVAAFYVAESLGALQLPLVIGGFPMVTDPQLQFAQFLPSAPQQAGSGATYEVRIPVETNVPGLAPGIREGYLRNEYPCEFIVLTNGGARYVSLGVIPAPRIEGGLVTNAGTLYIPDCHIVGVDPWAAIMLVPNPQWLVDPGPEGRVEVGEAFAGILLEGLATLPVYASSPLSASVSVTVRGAQIGTLSIAYVKANQYMTTGGKSLGALSGATGPIGALVTTLLQRTALAKVSGS